MEYQKTGFVYQYYVEPLHLENVLHILAMVEKFTYWKIFIHELDFLI